MRQSGSDDHARIFYALAVFHRQTAWLQENILMRMDAMQEPLPPEREDPSVQEKRRMDEILARGLAGSKDSGFLEASANALGDKGTFLTGEPAGEVLQGAFEKVRVGVLVARFVLILLGSGLAVLLAIEIVSMISRR